MTDRVWKSFNNTHGMSDRQKYNASHMICNSIVATIVSIKDQCGELSSSGTRRNGLHALADIGDYVADSTGRKIPWGELWIIQFHFDQHQPTVYYRSNDHSKLV